MSDEQRTVQETASQVTTFRYTYPALEPLEWEGPLGPLLPASVPGSLEDARHQAEQMADLIERAAALQMSSDEVYKLREYSGHLTHSISTHLSFGTNLALFGELSGILTAYRLAFG